MASLLLPCPLSLPGLSGWSPESIIRGPGGERVERAQSVSMGRAPEGSGIWQASSGAERLSPCRYRSVPPRPRGSSALETDEEGEDMPEWQQDEFDEELDNDTFSYDEESENLDRDAFFFGDEDEDESYD